MPENLNFGPNQISLAVAIEMTKRYRENKDQILKSEYSGSDLLALSETFDKDAFSSFMTNTAVKSIRIYYGMSADLKVHAILVGVNDQDEDILPLSAVTANTINVETTEDGGEIVEDGTRCPPICPPSSPLNEG